MLTKEAKRAERVQPASIEPMQVLQVRELPEGGNWTYEAKLDGYRCLTARRKGGVDGDVIVVGEDGRCSFNGLQHSRPKGHIQLYAFDILVHRGRNVLRLPIEERRKLLTEPLRKVEYPVIQSTPFGVKPAELIRAAKELQFEGVIAKRKGSLYEPGKRSAPG
jgi:bifunctional non-homologous end joining protein LigD